MDAPLHDYIVVGSGAGGGPLAANLARANFKVLLLEAGGDACAESDLGRYLYEVPIFHGMSTEYKECAWDYFVRHYTDMAQQARDSKYVEEKDGVFYPRAGTLGGCTAHNALIMVYPHNEDWDGIAKLTGDQSWSADRMRGYFEKLEDCNYRPLDRALAETTGLNPSRHGFKGWLQTEKA